MKTLVVFICFVAQAVTDDPAGVVLKTVAAEVTADVSDSPSFRTRTVLPGHTITPFHAINVPSTTRYLLFQAHTQTLPVSLSYSTRSPAPSSASDTGTNVGLAVLLDAWAVDAVVYVHNVNQGNVTALLVVSAHGTSEPLPGGCNLEFPVEVSPFLRLSLGSADATLEFQHASAGAPREAPPPQCDGGLSSFRYDPYLYYLDQWDFSESHYFDALSRMLDPASIRSNAHAVRAYRDNPKTRALFLTYPGEGTIYNVIVRQTTREGQVFEAAYVPVATYGCLWFSRVEACNQRGGPWALFMSLLLSLAGLIICFRGHRYFPFQMFFFGFLALSLISFMLFTKVTRMSANEGVLAALLGGVLGGIFWMLLWYFLAIPVLSIVVPGLLLGFLIAAIFLFTPVGEAAFLQNSISYWIFLGCFTLVPLLLLLPQTKMLSILSCSLVGSYCAILAADVYLGTSLSYIILNVIRRSLVPGGYSASNQVPFQMNDVLLSLIWAGLCIAGVVLQTWSERGRAPFPQSPYQKWLRERSDAGRPLLRTGPAPPPYYGAVGDTASPREPPPRYGAL
ncbi:transmembrane 7 superfamily member 3 isoform X1 [Ixodes scapularis]|uniref:transmembrane 7 superfamily member 3 isoform X1 n=1 Tax=Ixodes scapularis TaxID=6945 RepID=UPI001C38385C|nr:transmembrane 7 superfamily member 3 isoform X1 [Ixodes scapularis]